MHKKSQIGSFAASTPATIIIFIIIIVFIIASFIFLGKSTKVEAIERGYQESYDYKGNLFDQRALYDFLDREIKYNGENYKLKELVLYWASLEKGASKDKKIKNIFKNEFENFEIEQGYKVFSNIETNTEQYYFYRMRGIAESVKKKKCFLVNLKGGSIEVKFYLYYVRELENE